MKPVIACWTGTILFVFLWGCTPTKTVSNTAQAEEKHTERLVYLGNGICQDTSSRLMWHQGKSDIFLTWEEAKAYADQLAYGGYTDWRLPTKNELYILHDIFFWKKNGSCQIKTGGNYWTGVSKQDAVSGHWETYYLCSPEYNFVETAGKARVLAVRP